MGFVADVRHPAGFAMPASGSDEEGVDQALQVARSWAGLTEHGRILVSVEQLAAGQDVETLVSHETVHDVLLHGSVFGTQQIALSVFARPPWPEGVVQRTARKLLAASMGCTTRTQEACATFMPSLAFEGEALDQYWQKAPPDYRQLAGRLAWLRRGALPADAARHVVMALGGFALATRVPGEAFRDIHAFRQHLDEPAHRPDERFAAAVAAMEGLTDGDLAEVAAAPDAERRIAGAVAAHQTAGEPADLADRVEDWEAWFGLWDEVVKEMAAAWSAGPTVDAAARRALAEAGENSALLAQPPSPPLLKAALTNTVSISGGVGDHPPVGSLLGYELVELLYNGFGQEVPGIELVDGGGLPLGPEDAALWLTSPTRPGIAARLSDAELREFLARARDDVTLCVDDAGYLFPDGDVLTPAPLLQGRVHLVLLRQRSLGALLADPLLTDRLAGEDEAAYAVVDGASPGISYFLISPATSRSPVIVAPVPSPTAYRAVEEIGRRPSTGLRWTSREPTWFLGDDVALTVHLIRLFASFEGTPWPAGTSWEPEPGSAEPPPEPAAPPTVGGLPLGPPPRSAGRGGDALGRLPSPVRARLDAAGGSEAAGDLDRAADLYAGMTDDPDATVRAAGALALGMLRARQGEVTAGIEAFRVAATSGAPDLGPLGLLYLGQSLLAAGDRQGASEALLRAAQSGHPDHAPPAALVLARLLEPAGTEGPSRALYEWVVASEHPDVAPVAAEALERLVRSE